ncbi:hypothetical protein BgiBS90_006055 [Biomphalaria glabrata]|nr:hypothetical protein BgiBS90_006055 [Biomphalaria glabrata]
MSFIAQLQWTLAVVCALLTLSRAAPVPSSSTHLPLDTFCFNTEADVLTDSLNRAHTKVSDIMDDLQNITEGLKNGNHLTDSDLIHIADRNLYHTRSRVPASDVSLYNELVLHFRLSQMNVTLLYRLLELLDQRGFEEYRDNTSNLINHSKDIYCQVKNIIHSMERDLTVTELNVIRAQLEPVNAGFTDNMVALNETNIFQNVDLKDFVKSLAVVARQYSETMTRLQRTIQDTLRV